MTGIIGAMDVEVAALAEKITDKKTLNAAGIDFTCGKIGDREVCVAMCSPGKVNAAMCAQLMIDKFSPDEIINIGIGCSLSEKVTIKNVVVATEVCQYDFDCSAVDGYKGLLIDGKTSISADESLSDGLAAAAEKTGATVVRGGVATGDTFIASTGLKRSIAADFGAVCGEMEGGAIAQVCYFNGVPFAVMRTVSDGGNEDSAVDYPTFKKIAAQISISAVCAYLNAK